MVDKKKVFRARGNCNVGLDNGSFGSFVAEAEGCCIGQVQGSKGWQPENTLGS